MPLFFDVFQSSSMLILAVYDPDRHQMQVYYQIQPGLPAPSGEQLSRRLSASLEGLECRVVPVCEKPCRELEELLRRPGVCLVGWQPGAERDFHERVRMVLSRLGVRAQTPLHLLNLVGISESLPRNHLERIMAAWGAPIQYPLPRRRVSPREFRQRIVQYALGACQAACFLDRLYRRKDVQEGLQQRQALVQSAPMLRIPLQLSPSKIVRRILQSRADAAPLAPDLPHLSLELPVPNGKGSLKKVKVLKEVSAHWNATMDRPFPFYSFRPWYTAFHVLEGTRPDGQEDVLQPLAAAGLPGLILKDAQHHPTGAYVAMGKSRLMAGIFDQEQYAQDLEQWMQMPGDFRLLCTYVAQEKNTAVELLDVIDFQTSCIRYPMPSGKMLTPDAFLHYDRPKHAVLTASLPPTPFPVGKKLKKPAGSFFVQPRYRRPVYTPAWILDTHILKREILARLLRLDQHPALRPFFQDPTAPGTSSAARSPSNDGVTELLKTHAFSAFCSADTPELFRPYAVQSALLMELLLSIDLAMECSLEGLRPVTIFGKDMYVAGEQPALARALERFAGQWGIALHAKPCFVMSRGGSELAVLDPQLRKIQDFGGVDLSNCKAPGPKINTQPSIISKALSYILSISCRKQTGPVDDLTLDMARNYIRKIQRAASSMNDQLLLFSIPVAASDAYSLCFFQEQGPAYLLNDRNRVFLVRPDSSLPVQGQMLQVRVCAPDQIRKNEVPADERQSEQIRQALETAGIPVTDADCLATRSVYGLGLRTLCTVENRDLNHLPHPEALLDALDIDAYARQVQEAYTRWKLPRPSEAASNA